MYQGQIDFSNVIHSNENNSESEQILEANRERIAGQCKRVLELLQAGHRLTVYGAMVDHGISSLPRRVLDLKRKLGIEIKTEVIENRYKVYFL